MKRQEFAGLMSLASQTGVKTTANLSLPLRIVLFGSAPQIRRKFQPLGNREAIYCAL